MTSPTKPNFLFWFLAILGLAWHVMGAVNYVMQTNPDAVAQMPDHYRVVIETRPAWATGAFALSVFGGIIGGVLMILRSRLAAPVFLIAAVAALVTMLPMFGLDNATQAITGAGMSAILAAVLAWFCNRILR